MSKWYNSVVPPEVLNYYKNGERGPKPSSINMSNALCAFSLISLEQFGILPFNDTFVYNLKSKFTFGQFSGNQLGLVFKIAPDYVMWCIENAIGFVIDPNTLKILENQNVFDHNSLDEFISEIGNTLKIDLARFKPNTSGLPFFENVNEKPFKIPSELIKINNDKLERELSPGLAKEGGKWDFKNPLKKSTWYKKPTIKITAPTWFN